MDRRKKKKKRKLKVERIIIALILLVAIIFVLIKGVSFTKDKLIVKEYYLSSDTNSIPIYSYDKEQNTMNETKKIPRGTKVKSSQDSININDISYKEVSLKDEKFYVNDINLTEDKDKVVTETKKYVRTSVTVYKNETDSKISSFIKKGNEIDITGYDKLDDDGNVEMYKIKKDDIEGWVYSKYLVDTKELAEQNYNESNTYDTHKDRKYYRELYGGKASTLDYYPYEKVEFDNNPLMKKAKAMYLNAGKNVIADIDSYIKVATSSGVNTIVVDLKDGALAYPMEVAKEYSKKAYESAINSYDDYKKAIDKIKSSDIYVIGRIVVFNDPHYGADHPEDCIKSPVSQRLWPSAYSRGAWEYNVELAKQAIKDMGFNEIQFDYVRFPEDAYNMSQSNGTDFKNKYNEEKAEAVQNFLLYATDQIHKENVYLSVDVFGECSGTYVTSYGQYWPAISNIVDAISSMPYTDHFGRNVDTWTNAYQTVNNWAKTAAARQKEIPTPAIARTWITAYDTPYWKPTVIYDATKISDQAKALVDAGLDGGFITWNSASSLAKYQQIKGAFSKDY
ncbi:MAG: putative glycoside hydrolase [Erysipelotrichaceae bacterium]|nr:putative glycoside hydrolase [Erysipelotrichaceae bacterium]